MRIANLSVLALAFACSSSPDQPGGAGGAAGSNAAGGAAGSSSGGSVTQSNGGSPSTGGGPTSGNSSTSGAATGGKPAGGAAGAAGTSNGGASAGSAGASAGSGDGGGGGGGCVKNLACKLNPPPSTGDLYQDCVDRINQFLTQCACLPALERRMDGEACANQMAKYDAEQDSPHAGAIAKICTPGGAQNECPDYSSNNQVIGLCMQQMWDEGPPPTADCTGDCYQEHGHFINMTDTSVTRVACGFHTTASGKVWAVQNFSR